ncbi:hypothetical protein A2J03_09825 [Rhodococcus sp. EPR-157]|uniref:hypothetical protein n=1 Tax=Rhodococcus sp. EPR-157 TaxID=1813677 RepID=UPI0007BBD6D5|nr:hypothetical protein [Rhodococcus sp. EPR-157]KZF00874.1 hypothetical protein A2J03_09825 [Rhodococcus sp. EPR-157]
MHEFEQAHLVEKTPMTLKGGAFLATVPTPDRRVAIPRTVGSADRSQLDAEAVNEQTLNAAHDEGKFHAQYAMDFVGPSIDTGFRVLKYASRRYFVLTVEVAHILFKHYSFIERKDEAFLVGMHELKGVWGGKPYPVFAIGRELASSVPAQLLAKAFGSTIGIADEHPRCRPPEVLEAIAEYRKDAEWRGAIMIPGASWADFSYHSSAEHARSRLEILFDTSEEYLDTTQDAGEEESFEDMPTH